MSNYEKLREYCIDKDVITIDCTCLCGHDELDHRSHCGIVRGSCEHGDCCKEFQVDASKPQMQIADVMRAIEENVEHGDLYHILASGELYNWKHEDVCLFNLALPLSHPDNEDAREKVLNLLK